MIKSPINRVSQGSVLIILGATMRGFHALQASSVMAITKCHFRAPVPTRRVESEQAEQLDRSALNPLLCIERVRRYLAPRPHRPPRKVVGGSFFRSSHSLTQPGQHLLKTKLSAFRVCARCHRMQPSNHHTIGISYRARFEGEALSHQREQARSALRCEVQSSHVSVALVAAINTMTGSSAVVCRRHVGGALSLLAHRPRVWPNLR